jgi:uncharacterized membrane protein YgaE (UPF0421/DUF939 family)
VIDKSDGKGFNELIKFPHVAFAIWTAIVCLHVSISSSLLLGRRPHPGSAAQGTVQLTLHHQMSAVVLQYEGHCVMILAFFRTMGMVHFCQYIL